MKQKRCLITGVGSGLGKYLACALGNEQWEVFAVGRQEYSSALGIDEAHYIRANLSVESEAREIPRTLSFCPDLIVHCAVDYPTRSNTFNFDTLARVFNVNAFSPYVLTQDLLALKEPERFSCIVMINSEAIFSVHGETGAYAASKAALKIFSAALADQYRSDNVSIATLLLGPLPNQSKLTELQELAARKGISVTDLTKLFLRKSNRNLVIDQFIDYEACVRSILYIYGNGRLGNGMLCRLDGGSAGALI